MSEHMKAIEEMDTETLIQATLARIRERQGEAQRDAKRWQSRAESAEARVEELTTENARLEQEVTAAELRKSPAEQEVNALSDERDTLEAEVRRLHGRVKCLTDNIDDQKKRLVEVKAERDAFQAGRQELKARVEELAAQRDRQHERMKALGAERDDLRTENERVTYLRDKFFQDSVRLQKELEGVSTAVRRVIEPSDLREGQTVAAYVPWLDEWRICAVHEDQREDEPYTLESYDLVFPPRPDTTLVLLADAPEDADVEEGDGNMYIDVAPSPGSAAGILQSINGSIARALTTRRGEVINPDDLHTGDVIDVWAPGGKRDVKGHVVRSLGLWRDVGQLPGNEIRLVRRPSCDCGCGATP